jgi:hypothetical protein
MWYAPGPTFGYTLKKIDAHPWDTLLTMKEVLRLEPGSIEFTGPDAERHLEFWRQSQPEYFTAGKTPVFVHPHKVESEPRRPFRPWKD